MTITPLGEGEPHDDDEWIDTTHFKFHSEARTGPSFVPAFYEVVGRVLLCVSRGHLAGLHGLGDAMDWWETAEGCLAIEWHGGPYAHEVAVKLISLANDPIHNGRLRPGSVVWSPTERAHRLLEAGWALLRVDGLEVQLRAMSPLGEEEARRRRPMLIRPQPAPV